MHELDTFNEVDNRNEVTPETKSAFAQRCCVSRGVIRRAIENGKIDLEPDGRIDPLTERNVCFWADTTEQALRRMVARGNRLAVARRMRAELFAKGKRGEDADGGE